MTDLNFEGIRENQNTKGCTPAYLALIDNFARQYTPQILFDVQRGDGIYTADRASLRQYSKNGELSYFFGLLEIYNAEGLRRKDITIFSPLDERIISEICLDPQERINHYKRIIDEERTKRLRTLFSLCRFRDTVGHQNFADFTVNLGDKKETFGADLELIENLIKRL